MFVDYTLLPSTVLIFGQRRSGKTTFAIRYLLNADGVACRFIFDDRGQLAHRLNLKHVGTAADCEAALATGWVCFNPHVMFPNKLSDALRWFCHWVLDCSKRGPGRKILFIDEAWQWMDSRTGPPPELDDVIRTGPIHALELCMATHSAREFHRDVRKLVTEWVVFNTIEPDELDAIRPYWPGVDQAATLQRGEFLAFSRENRTELRGRLF